MPTRPGCSTFWIRGKGARSGSFWCVHGTPDRQAAFETALHEHGYGEVVSPEYGETVAL